MRREKDLINQDEVLLVDYCPKFIIDIYSIVCKIIYYNGFLFKPKHKITLMSINTIYKWLTPLFINVTRREKNPSNLILGFSVGSI